MRVASPACRWLASAAWTLSLGWFWLATAVSWGFTPGAMLTWTLAALPLAFLTVRWLEQSGRAPGRRLIGLVAFTWVLLCACALLLSYFYLRLENPQWPPPGITDPTSGFYAVGPRAMRLLAEHHPSGYAEAELRLFLSRNQLEVIEVAVAERSRLSGKTSLTPRRMAGAAARVVLAMAIVPLRRRMVETSGD